MVVFSSFMVLNIISMVCLLGISLQSRPLSNLQNSNCPLNEWSIEWVLNKVPVILPFYSSPQCHCKWQFFCFTSHTENIRADSSLTLIFLRLSIKKPCRLIAKIHSKSGYFSPPSTSSLVHSLNISCWELSHPPLWGSLVTNAPFQDVFNRVPKGLWAIIL
jgi:hypothetical protein